MSVAMLIPFGNNIKSLHVRLFLDVRPWQYGPPDAYCDWPYLLSLQKWQEPPSQDARIPRFVVQLKKQRSLSRKMEYSHHEVE